MYIFNLINDFNTLDVIILIDVGLWTIDFAIIFIKLRKILNKKRKFKSFI